MSICPDCGVGLGEAHDDGCDVARCLVTGRQRLSCLAGHDHGKNVWSGRWPGEVEAEEFGFWCRWTGQGWVECGPGPTAELDLNRLVRECGWNPDTLRWERTWA